MSTKENKKLQDKCDIELPQNIIDSFARFLVPEIRKYYESKEGQEEFIKWEAHQKEKDTSNK